MVGLLFAVSLPVLAYLPLMPAGMLFHVTQFLLLNLLLLLSDVLCHTISLCVCLHWFLLFMVHRNSFGGHSHIKSKCDFKCLLL